MHTQNAVNDYDDFAHAYSIDNENNLTNGHYERPAMIDLAGNVRGKHILDAGCGSGPLSAALRDQGATVAGFDASTKMIELARQRLGPGTELHVADLGGPLPFDDGAFDDVVCSLVLHYLQDWSGALTELHRMLRPGGRLIASVNHPIIHKMIDPEAAYFATAQWSQTHTFDGRPTTLTYWHRPLHAMTDAFTQAGFRITRISEPPFSPHTPAELIPAQLQGRTSFLSFLFFVLHKD